MGMGWSRSKVASCGSGFSVLFGLIDLPVWILTQKEIVIARFLNVSGQYFVRLAYSDKLEMFGALSSKNALEIGARQVQSQLEMTRTEPIGI